MGRLRSILREYSVDRFGAAIFFGSLCFTGLYWQVGVFINDNYTIVNTLLNLSEGRLYFEPFYGSELVKWPGTVHIDDRPYGRSYGIAFAALPFLWATTLLEPILGLRLIAVGFWSVGVLGLAVQIGALVGRRRSVLLAACTLIGSVVVANALLTSPTDINRIHRYVLSLQMLAITATATIGVLIYRLMTYVEDRTIGIYAGVTTVLATNIAFWGWIPKRHIFTALLALVAIYGFAMSREFAPLRSDIRYRGAAYAAIGLTAWINAAEAAVLFTVLVPLDLATARSNSARRLAILASVFVFSLVPFFITNTITTGDPFTSPLMAADSVSTLQPVRAVKPVLVAVEPVAVPREAPTASAGWYRTY